MILILPTLAGLSLVGLFLKRGLVWGQLIAVFWWSSNFWSSKFNKDRKVPVLPLKKPVKMLPTKWIPTPAFILFNLPLLIVLGYLLALVPVVFGASAKWLWLYFPLGVAVAITLSALVKRHPRLLRRWRELVFFPALVAMALGLFFGPDSFFIIFLRKIKPNEDPQLSKYTHPTVNSKQQKILIFI